MSDNPYLPPVTDQPAVGVLSGRREDLRSVALYQKGILICVLVYLLAMIFQFALPEEIRPLVGLAVLLVGLVGTVFVFLLAIKVYSVAAGVLLGLLAIVPCVGLIVLLIVNGKATSILRQNDIRVGFMGAKLSEI